MSNQRRSSAASLSKLFFILGTCVLLNTGARLTIAELGAMDVAGLARLFTELRVHSDLDVRPPLLPLPRPPLPSLPARSGGPVSHHGTEAHDL